MERNPYYWKVDLAGNQLPYIDRQNLFELRYCRPSLTTNITCELPCTHRSPMDVAYALAGTMRFDIEKDALGTDPNGQPITLKDIWPSQAEIQQAVAAALDPQMFKEQYADVFTGNDTWNSIAAGETAGQSLYAWNPESTYIQEPPYFEGLGLDVVRVKQLAAMTQEERVKATAG